MVLPRSWLTHITWLDIFFFKYVVFPVFAAQEKKFPLFRLVERLERNTNIINNVNRTEPMPTTDEPNNIWMPQNPKPFRYKSGSSRYTVRLAGDELFPNRTFLLSRAQPCYSNPTLSCIFRSPGEQEEFNIKHKTDYFDFFKQSACRDFLE